MAQAEEIKQFCATVFDFYRRHKRDLPWRKTQDPYKILVSEVMLQQTQVARVIPKYKEFLHKFPIVVSLAQATPSQVLRIWQGLGYNRRALYLYKTAQIVVKNYNGRFPTAQKALTELPGIGVNTAGAIITFAYNKPAVFIETNIRSAFIHHFFKNRSNISDKKVLQLITAAVDKKNPRDWYWALMDYGSHIKKLYQNPSRKSAHHIRQSPFEGSNRQLRGRIIRLLLQKDHTTEEIRKATNEDTSKLKTILLSLQREGFILYQKGLWRAA